MSPQPSYHSTTVVRLVKRALDDPTLLCRESERASCCNSITSSPSNSSKSCAELMKEISVIEGEIMHLELHLLSLYRKAFKLELPSLEDNRTFQEQPKNASSPVLHRSLADHLGASLTDYTLHSPDRLSEEILRCMSSIYRKVAQPTVSRERSFASSNSSFSSSSTFSPENPYDSGNSKDNSHDNGYATTIAVLNICLDDDSFNYAAKILQNFRSLVHDLKKVDPRKMKREEQLVFWINIHNSLLMHAYLAYGTDNVISTSVLKAAYNIGGHWINAYTIQSSILGSQSHYSTPWLRALFSPGNKLKKGGRRHVYAIEYLEPLVHFALCSGAYSDPVLRVYRVKTLFEDLKLAKEEFIQAKVYIDKERNVFLPKILHDLAKDMSLSTAEIIEFVNECLCETQQKAIKRCFDRRGDKCIHWKPRSSTFRFLIHDKQ